MGRCSKVIFTAFLLFLSFEALCCTAVIISGSARADGRPVMLKHRDTGELNNRMQWFQGSEYSFIGLVNASSKGGEVWTGTNSAGFCIMNTATYDLKDDDVPSSEMDKEGIMMYEVLGICRNIKDFENYLDTLPKPWGVEANFGIIDAEGGAACYEVNNHSWKKYDVAAEPGGYMVVTNFTRSGRVEDRKGVDRYEKAVEIFASMDISKAGHKEIFNEISRSGNPILRDITSAAVVLEGVQVGEDPLKTVMWTILGSPANCIYLPLKVFRKDNIPSFMKEVPGKEKSQICSQSLVMKGIYGIHPGCLKRCMEVEKIVDEKFDSGMSALKYNCYIRNMYRKFKLMYKRKLPKTLH